MESIDDHEWGSDVSSSTPEDSDDGDEYDEGLDGEEEEEEPAVRERPQQRRESKPMPRMKRTSYMGSVTGSNTVLGAYRNALQRASLVDTSAMELDGDDVSAETRERHAESKKRVALADGTQLLLLKAHELSAEVEDMPLWVGACVVPQRWRSEALRLVAPVHKQMEFCRQELLLGWQLLFPPFDQHNLAEYERRYHLLELGIDALERVIVDVQSKLLEGEQFAACSYIQLWYRRLLAARGFYTKKLRIGRRHRGLIPGMFDSVPGKSKLTIHPRTGLATLEYPSSGLEFGFMD